MAEASTQQQFPEPLRPVRWGPVEAVFVPSPILPPRHLIAHVNLVPFVGDDAVVIYLKDGRPELAGGTLEPAEDYLTALQRELMEEAGARLRSFTLLGAWQCRSAALEPYRPHLPHPDFYRVVGYGNVDPMGKPTNPHGGEQIVAVDTIPVAAAVAQFRQWQRPDIAALYLLAHHERQMARSEEC